MFCEKDNTRQVQRLWGPPAGILAVILEVREAFTKVMFEQNPERCEGLQPLQVAWRREGGARNMLLVVANT